MRIVGGSRRGMRLVSVPGQTTRPTADRVKEALFNMLMDRVTDAVVLDLFAGSGGLGLEALSRGATRAVFVEKNRRAAAVLRQNAARTGFEDRSVVVVADALQWLKEQADGTGTGDEGPFDLIFIDAPYRQQLAVAAVHFLGEGRLLAEDGLLVVEHDRREELPPVWKNVEQIRTRRYGDTALTFYKGGP